MEGHAFEQTPPEQDPLVQRLVGIVSPKQLHQWLGGVRSVALAKLCEGDKTEAAELELAARRLEAVASQIVGHPGLCEFCGDWIREGVPCCSRREAMAACPHGDPRHLDAGGCPSCAR